MGKTRNTTYAGILTNPQTDPNDSNSNSIPNPPTNPLPEIVPAAALESINQQFGLLFSKLSHIDADLSALKKEKGKEIFHGESSKSGNLEDGGNETPWWFKKPSQRPHSKIDFPKFEGGDPRGWIMNAEKYFRYYQTPENLKVDVASMYLEGHALDTYTWISSRKTIHYWDELVQILNEQFGPAEFQNPDAFLCKIKQTGTVNEYKQEFVSRSSRVTGWPEHCLLGVFLNGLKEELQADVKIHKPRTVYKAVSLAMEIETKINSSSDDNMRTSWEKDSAPNYSQSTHESKYPFNTNFSPSQNYNQSSYPQNQPQQNLQQLTHLPAPQFTSPTTPIISITQNQDLERQTRREKGLCFKCGAKFMPGHRCNPSLRIMEVTAEKANEVCKNLDDPLMGNDGEYAVISRLSP